MKNFMLSWDFNKNTDPREQKLSQLSGELMKIYSIPDRDTKREPAQFVPLNGLNIRQYMDDKPKALDQLLQQISAQVGYEKEWRLIIFLMRDVDLFGSGHDVKLVKFLAHIMYYAAPTEERPSLEDCCLACEKPENIWLVTLRNNSGEGVPLPCQVPHPDETCYSLYPPNCRFLRYALDYQRANRFRRTLLELHCGVRSLARNALPPDLLRGNRVYCLEVELDEELLCDSVALYDLWLRHVDQTLSQRDRHLPPATLSLESVPIIDDISESRPDLRQDDTYAKEPGKALRQLESEADEALDRDGQEARLRLQNGIERLQIWEVKQGHQVMSASEEKNCRAQMEEQELKMLEVEIKGKSRWLNRTADYLFHLRGTLASVLRISGTEETRTEADFIREYREMVKIKEMMERDRTRKIMQVIRSMTLVFLFILAAMARAAAAPNWTLIFFCIGVSILSIPLTYAAYEYCYKIRCERAFKAIVSAQEERVFRSRKYFKEMTKYLRLNWLLHYHEMQKGEIEDERTTLRAYKRKLDHYMAVCMQLKLCCIGMHGGVKALEPQGSIQRMLREGSNSELFGMPGRLPELRLNGNCLTGAFPFVKAVSLKKAPDGIGVSGT